MGKERVIYLGYDCFFEGKVKQSRDKAVDRFIPNRKESHYDSLKSNANSMYGSENNPKMAE